MNNNKSIKIKAAFLLTVFALNTVIAFACSVGLKMGYNNQHHHQESVQHTHSDNSSSHHHEKTSASHAHKKTSASHHDKESNSGKGDCCTDNAIKFQKEDKKLQQSQNIAIKAPVFVAFLSAFLGLEIAPPEIIEGITCLIPQYYPPPPDIRIAIQSFQI